MSSLSKTEFLDQMVLVFDHPEMRKIALKEYGELYDEFVGKGFSDDEAQDLVRQFSDQALADEGAVLRIPED